MARSPLVLLVAAIIFLDTMFFTALTPLLPHYADELGIGKTGAGLLQAAYPIGTFLGAIPSGMVAAQLGPKRTVLGGLAALAVSSLAFAFAGRSGSWTRRDSCRACRARSRGRAGSRGSSRSRRPGVAAG